MERYEKAEESAERIMKDSDTLASIEFDISQKEFDKLKARIDIARNYLNKVEIKLSNWDIG